MPYQQNKLDQYLLGSCEDIITDGVALHPYGVTGEMEEHVIDNFNLINTFEKDLTVFNGHGSIKILLGHFQDLFAKVAIASIPCISTHSINECSPVYEQ